MQADREAIQEQISAVNTQLSDLYKNILHTLHVWQQRLDENIAKLEAEVKQATAQTKADAEKRLTEAKEARETLRANVKAMLSARLDTLKTDIGNLKTQAANARGEAQEKLNQRAAELEAEWEAEDKRLTELDTAYGEAWETMVDAISKALDTYDASVREAENQYEKAV